MKKEVWAIFLVVFVGLLGYSIILPILPFYAETFGASPFVAGLLFTSYAMCVFFAGPIFGGLSDRHGRKPLLIISQIGTVIGFLIMGFATSLAMLFFARILDGISGGNIVIANAYIADITKPEDRAKTYGLIGVAFGLGFIVGPALGGVLAQWGYALPAFVAAAISAISILLTYFLLPETRKEKHKVEADLPNLWTHLRNLLVLPRTRTYLLEFFLFTLIFYTFTTNLTLYLERTIHATPSQLGYLYGFVGVLVLFGQGVLLRILLKRWGESTIAKFGFALSLAGFIVLILLSDDWIWIIVAAILFSQGVSQLRPVLTSLITKKADTSEQGRVLGVTQSIDSAAAILGPAMGGFVITYGPIQTFGIVEAIGATIGLTILLRRS